MIVFGDSLSDNGNLSLALGLPRSRFTTNPGLVTVEYIGQHYGLGLEPSISGGTDFAWGGAGLINGVQPVPTLADQVRSYLSAHPQAGPNALFAMWGGSNDIFYHSPLIASGAETQAQANAQMAAAAKLEGDLISQLQAAGVRRMIVFNVPDIGIAPGGAPQDTILAQTFNAALNAQLAGRKGIVPVNTFALFREAVANPGQVGLTNASTPACTVSISLLCTPATLVQPNAASTFVFADDVHPATAAQQGLADAVIGELDAPGQMSLLAEAPLSLLRGHRAAVRAELDRPAAETPGVSLFATARAGAGRLDGDLYAPTSRTDEEAVTFGGIWRSGAVAVGAALTVGESRAKLQTGLGSFKAKEVAGTLFGQYSWASGGWASLQAGIGGADYDDIARSFALLRGFRTESSSSKGRDESLELAGGRWFDWAGLRTGPFVAWSYDHVHVGDVVETGGDATAMWFAPQNRYASVARAGWSLQGSTTVAGFTLEPVAQLAYGHDFSADRREVTAGLTTFNGQFDMPGYQPPRDWGEASVGLEADVRQGLRARISYQGLFGDRSRENLGSLSVSYRF
jgi:outer membrane lipase/esterase